MKGVAPPPRLLVEGAVRRALEEDLGGFGDLTSDAVLPEGGLARGALVARSGGRVAGLEVARLAFELLDPSVRFAPQVADGGDVEAATTVATVAGSGRLLLAAERTALNFLAHLSGIATATRELVREVEAFPAQIVCTRKTTPGLRTLEKYAVRLGGAANHRFGLDDGVLIKDNHRRLAGGLVPALQGLRERLGHMVRVEVEVDTLEELDQALEHGADAVLLDNMSLVELRQAVERCRGRAITEASGGVRPNAAAAVAESGVDLISVGWLTHSAPALDVAFDVL